MRGNRVRPGVGRTCFVLMACFALLMGFSAWRLYSYLAEERREKVYMETLQSRVVSAREEISTAPTEQVLGSYETHMPEVVEPSAPELPPITVDFETLQEENPDTVGWIYCPDTEVNYPVLRSNDNSYYLRRLSNGSYHIAGSIFADYRNAADLSNDNVIIYGHNMSNGSMFALLPNYAEQEFYDAHPVWYLLTPTVNYRVELFAGFVTSTKSLVYSIKREYTEDGRSIMEKAWDDSNFRGGPAPAPGERTVTLSTCSYQFDGARYVLIGVLRELNGALPPDEGSVRVTGLLNTEDHVAYISEYEDGTMRPEQNIRRDEVAMSLYKLLREKPKIAPEGRFSDMPRSGEITEAVETLATLGILNGYDDGCFHPDRSFTRAEAATLFYRLLAFESVPRTVHFPDVPRTPEEEWYVEPVETLAAMGIVKGCEDGNYHPERPITRAEFCVMLNRLLGRSPDTNWIDGHAASFKQYSDVTPSDWYYYELREAAETHQYSVTSDQEIWIGLK